MSTISEIIFEVSEDEIDGGYSATALGYGIHTEGEAVEELRANVREAVECYFDETMPAPAVIRLHLGEDTVEHPEERRGASRLERRRAD